MQWLGVWVTKETGGTSLQGVESVTDREPAGISVALGRGTMASLLTAPPTSTWSYSLALGKMMGMKNSCHLLLPAGGVILGSPSLSLRPSSEDTAPAAGLSP